jgi:hypothetical protein
MVSAARWAIPAATPAACKVFNRPSLDHPIKLINVSQAAHRIGESGIAGPTKVACGSAEPLPFIVAEYAYGAPLVHTFAAIAVVGSSIGVSVAYRLGHPFVYSVVQVVFANERGSYFYLRHIDELSLASATPIVESYEDGKNSLLARHVIG